MHEPLGGTVASWLHSALDPGATGPGLKPWPGTLCYVLEQDTLLSQCFSPTMCIMGYGQMLVRL